VAGLFHEVNIMPVKGGRRTAKALQRVPARVKTRVQDAIEDAAGLVLADMRAFTPYDTSNPGPHARDGLTIRYEGDRLTAHVGLPSRDLAQDYFWFRFLDSGTRGGEASYRSRQTGKRITVRVPARPALRIRERALEGNLPEIKRLVNEAVRDGVGRRS
jgi:hypothetical protein